MSVDARFDSVSPIFQVSHLQRGIDYYVKVLGFEVGWTWGTPPDRVSLCRDSVEITLEVERLPLASKVYIQVKGIDEYYRLITAAGAVVKSPLANRVYGMRDCTVLDPDGNGLAIGESSGS